MHVAPGNWDGIGISIMTLCFCRECAGDFVPPKDKSRGVFYRWARCGKGERGREGEESLGSQGVIVQRYVSGRGQPPFDRGICGSFFWLPWNASGGRGLCCLLY